MAGEVRELIRRRGLDPFTDPAPVRVLVRDVVAEFSERSLNSALPPIGDPGSVVRDVLDRVAGFGPLRRYLDDPAIEDAASRPRRSSRPARPRKGQPGRFRSPRGVDHADHGRLLTDEEASSSCAVHRA